MDNLGKDSNSGPPDCSIRNKRSLKTNPNPVPDTSEVNDKKSSNKCASNKDDTQISQSSSTKDDRQISQSLENASNADIVNPSEQMKKGGEEPSSRGSNSNKRNADQVCHNKLYLGQDANYTNSSNECAVGLGLSSSTKDVTQSSQRSEKESNADIVNPSEHMKKGGEESSSRESSSNKRDLRSSTKDVTQSSQSSEKASNADIVNPSEQMKKGDKEPSAHGSNSNKRNTDQVCHNKLYLGQDANYNNSSNECAVGLGLRSSTKDVTQSSQSSEKASNADIVNPSEHMKKGGDEPSSGGSNSNKRNTDQVCQSELNLGQDANESGAVLEVSAIKVEDAQIIQTMDGLKNQLNPDEANSTMTKENGTDNQTGNRREGFFDSQARIFCAEKEDLKQNCVNLKMRECENQESGKHLSEKNERCESANDQMQLKNLKLEMIKRVAVKLNKDWLCAMRNDFTILHELSSKYDVHFNKDKYELSGNIDDLVRVREYLNRSVQKEFSKDYPGQECQLNMQDNRPNWKSKDSSMNGQHHSFDHSTQPNIPPRVKKTKAQGAEASNNDCCEQEIAQNLRNQDQEYEQAFDCEPNRYSSASGACKQEILNSTSARMNNEAFPKNLVIPGKQEIMLKVNKQCSASIEFDADIYDYIVSILPTEIDGLKKQHDLKFNCSAKEQDVRVKLDIYANSGMNLDEGVDKWQKWINKVSKCHCIIPSDYLSLVDVKRLNTTIQNDNKKKKVFINFEEGHNMWKIIGSLNDAKKTEKWINQQIDFEYQVARNNSGHQIKTRKSTNSARGLQHDSGIDKCNVVNKQPQRQQNTVSNYPSISAQSYKLDTSAFSIISIASSANSLVFTAGPNHIITVYVECRDMLKPFSCGKFPDAIVSPCDIELSCQSGLSKAIMDKAGPSVRSLCNTKGPIRVTDHLRTDAGNMRAKGLKFIMHAVGPDPLLCNKNIGMIKDMTSETYYNCLMAANFSSEVNSIALPLLGVGNYKVPIVSVAWSLLAALQQFSTHLTESSDLNLKHIYVVCNDLSTIKDAWTVFRKYITVSTV